PGMLDAVDGVDRIRYTSPHPKHMREDVIRAHAELPSLCEHIHLPLQSGSSRILKAMRRTYNRERYLDRVALIREHVPDVALTTDIIVGFPGETEDDFTETLDVVERVGYDSAFTFVFSPRRGTLAADYGDQVSHPVKRERTDRLRERGEDPVAVSADALQVYAGLETLTGAATAAERARLEHRLIGFVDPSETFSVGEFMPLAHAEIDAARAGGRRPIVVGGTGLYLRAALTDLSLAPAPPPELRARIEADVAARGPAALHEELRARSPVAAAAIEPT